MTVCEIKATKMTVCETGAGQMEVVEVSWSQANTALMRGAIESMHYFMLQRNIEVI